MLILTTKLLVIASEGIQLFLWLDCFVASLLAMTQEGTARG